jgi:hypothetical protein
METESGREGQAGEREGPVGERRRRADGAVRQSSDGERVGAFAARVLDDLYALIYGERPVGVRVWCDGSALLMLVRLAGPVDETPAEVGVMLPSEAIPELVATAVRAQTGWDLAIGSWSVEADLGLVMFVFRLPDEPPVQSRYPEPELSELAGGDELDIRRAARWGTTHIPSWRAWSPVPRGGVTPDADTALERRRLRAVED